MAFLGTRYPSQRLPRPGPPHLRTFPHWVTTIPRPGPNGKLDKPPLQLSGALARSNDSSSWASWDQVLRARAGDPSRILGFVCSPDSDVCGLDFDSCRDPESGRVGFTSGREGTVGVFVPRILPWLGTYCSVSPSGTGIRAWARGSLLDGGAKFSRLGVELYSQGQYLTETGERLADFPRDAMDREARIRLLFAGLSLLDRAARSGGSRFAALWMGESAHGSASESDFALISRLARAGGDAALIEMVMSWSGVWRSKWEERRGELSWLGYSIQRVLERASEPLGAPEDAVARELARLRAREQAQRLLREELAPKTPFAGFEGAGSWLRKVLPPVEYAVQDLLVSGQNLLFSAQYKAGKTTTVLNLIRSLCDGQPFLGRFACRRGTVAYSNLEMNENQLQAWVRDMEISNTGDLRIGQWKGRVPSLGRDREALVSSLRGADTWIIDAFADLFPGDENSNTEVSAFLADLDGIKRDAGISNLVLIHHTGRKEHEEGAEHGRGATRLDDWADARWSLVRSGDVRFFAADGRDVGRGAREPVGEFALEYDHELRSLTAGDPNLTRRQAKETSLGRSIDTFKQHIQMVMRENPALQGQSWRVILAALGFRKDTRGTVARDELVAEGKLENRGTPTAGAWYLIEENEEDPAGATPVEVPRGGVGKAGRVRPERRARTSGNAGQGPEERGSGEREEGVPTRSHTISWEDTGHHAPTFPTPGRGGSGGRTHTRAVGGSGLPATEQGGVIVNKYRSKKGTEYEVRRFQKNPPKQRPRLESTDPEEWGPDE